MKYIVKRTSLHGNSDCKPCEEATIEPIHKMLAITIPMYEKTNHYKDCVVFTKTENDIMIGHYKVPEGAWVVDIPDLKALHEFIKKYGECIIYDNCMNYEGYYVIEIYDDCRE